MSPSNRQAAGSFGAMIGGAFGPDFPWGLSLAYLFVSPGGTNRLQAIENQGRYLLCVIRDILYRHPLHGHSPAICTGNPDRGNIRQACSPSFYENGRGRRKQDARGKPDLWPGTPPDFLLRLRLINSIKQHGTGRGSSRACGSARAAVCPDRSSAA